jgi:hypothetical protein
MYIFHGNYVNSKQSHIHVPLTLGKLFLILSIVQEVVNKGGFI